MPTFNPAFSEKEFLYSCRQAKSDIKLRNKKLDSDSIQRIIKVGEVLKEITLCKLKWSEIPSTTLLYSGRKANQIKQINDKDTLKKIKDSYNKSSMKKLEPNQEIFPVYLAITKEIRLFGFQFKQTFYVVLIDLYHGVLKSQ